MDPTEPCACGPCTERQSLDGQIMKPMPLGNVSKLAPMYATKIFKSYQVLKQATTCHRSRLAKQWMSLDFDQRQAFLKELSSEIPREHRPDLLCLRQMGTWGNFSIKRRALDAPQINIEDLCDDNDGLLELMKSRADCHPADFILLDAQNAGLKPSNGHFGEKPWTHHMVFHGQITFDTYGKLVRTDELQAEGKLCTGVIYPLGMLALRTQTGIMKFLEDCCRKMLPDIDFDSLPMDTIKPTALQSLAGGWLSAEPLTANVDFVPAGKLRLMELDRLVEGMVLAAEDHICCLFANPYYLLETLRETGKHYPKVENDLQERADWFIEGAERGPGHQAFDSSVEPVLRKVVVALIEDKKNANKGKAQTALNDRWYWGRVASLVMTEAHCELLFWGNMRDQLRILERLLSTTQVSETPCRLPPELEQAFIQLEFLIACIDAVFTTSLKTGVVACEEMRHLYARDFKTQPELLNPGTADIAEHNASYGEFTAHCTLSAMCNHEKTFHSRYALVDGFRHMLRTDAKAAALVLGRNAHISLTLAVNSAVITELDQFQPWVCVWRHVASLEQFENHPIRREVVIISNAAWIASTEHPIDPTAKSMQETVAARAVPKQAEKQYINIERTCDQFMNSFYNALEEYMPEGHPLIQNLAYIIGLHGYPKRKEGNATDMVASMENLTVSGKSEGSKVKPTAASAPVARDNPNDFIHKVMVHAAATLWPYRLPADPFVVDGTQWIWRIIYSVSATDHTTELPFEHFCLLMEGVGLDTVEAYWPIFHFYPRPGSPWTRGFCVRAPHANCGKWTAKEIRAIRARLDCWRELQQLKQAA